MEISWKFRISRNQITTFRSHPKRYGGSISSVPEPGNTKGVLWRACNLTSFSPCITGPVDYLFASRHKGPRFKSPGGGVLMWNRDSPVRVVSLHWWPQRDWPFLWPRLRRALSQTITRPSCRQCDNPTWSHTALLSWFHAGCRSPSGFTTDRVSCWGGVLWRAYNLTSFSPCLTGPVDYLFASRHKGPRF